MVHQETLEYQSENGDVFEGILIRPSDAVGGNLLPGVIIYHAFMGITDHEIEAAKKLTKKLNVIALVADVYGKEVRPKEPQEAFGILLPLLEEREKNFRPRLEATLRALKRVEGLDQTKIGAMGYCLGGICTIDMARYNLDFVGGVSFHGSLKPLPNFPITPIKPSLLIQHGDADSHIPKEQVDAFMTEMRERNADFVFTSHAHAEHAFTEPKADLFKKPGVSYNKKADKRSWCAMLNFFEELFHAKL
ncbi:unnamed protein product [Caenorhabditis auriculariae]|uniref:Dienelactone hydrolase domain-containing protein n=1 Tax=Caenorhabditis auriculariae TaxID=2777116 RepID=A0A8S1H8E3_9PELO|nr:unnamed protein product [Caenorhabditis auriculariae]